MSQESDIILTVKSCEICVKMLWFKFEWCKNIIYTLSQQTQRSKAKIFKWISVSKAGLGSGFYYYYYFFFCVALKGFLSFLCLVAERR